MRSTVSTAQLAEHLRTSVTRTARRLRQEADTGLSPTLIAALATIDRFGPLTPSEIAERERVKRPTATRLIAALEDQALVERTADPDDRRSSIIAATADGRALLARTRERKDVFLARRLADLRAEDRATLERAAQLLEQLLEDRR